MAARVIERQGKHGNTYTVVVDQGGRRKKKSYGSNRQKAQKVMDEINRRLVAGAFQLEDKPDVPLRCDVELRTWLENYGPTLKPGYRQTAAGIIKRHLAPHFGAQDLRALEEDDLLNYLRAKLDVGLAPATVRGHLAILQRVITLLRRKRKLAHNPAERLGELFRQVGRSASEQVREVDAWTRSEAQTLLSVAREHEKDFYPLLAVLLGTGMRRGEALGLRWTDVDLEGHQMHVRRSWSKGYLTTPKSGKGRRVDLVPWLAEALFDLAVERRRQALQRGWPDVPEWVFCSETGDLLDESNVGRVWRRLRRRAQKKGVRPLKLHSARHTWATLALGASKSPRWVADQLGHRNPSFTMNVYSHALPREEHDLSFVDFGATQDQRRTKTSQNNEGASDAIANPSENLVELGGIEPPTLRLPA